MSKEAPWEDVAPDPPPPPPSEAPSPWEAPDAVDPMVVVPQWGASPNPEAGPGRSPIVVRPGAPPSALPRPSEAPDALKGLLTGVGEFGTGAVGLPGTIANVAKGVSEWAGAPPAALASVPAPPDPAAVQKWIEDNLTGPWYRPQTQAGKTSETFGMYGPGMLLGPESLPARAVNTFGGIVGSEAGGAWSRGTPNEPYYRFAGGLAGPLIGAKLVTPTQLPRGPYLQATNTLENAGVPLTAGARTNNMFIKQLERLGGYLPWTARMGADIKIREAEGLNQALTNAMFDRPTLTRMGVDPEDVVTNQATFAAGRQSLQNEYQRLAQNGLTSHPQFWTELLAPLQQYRANAAATQVQAGLQNLDARFHQIADHFVAHNGVMPGNVYQATRSNLGNLADAAEATDPALATAYRGMRAALDEGMFRGLSPQDATAWQMNNRRWALMNQYAPAIAGSGEFVSGPRLAQQAGSGGRTMHYATAAGGELDRIAKAAGLVLKQVPESGTPAGIATHDLMTNPTHALGIAPVTSSTGGTSAALTGLPGFGYAIGGIPGAVAGGAVAVALPSVAVTPWGQAWLGNRVLPQRPRDVLARALVQQSIVQPAVNANNRRERAATEQRMQDETRRRYGLGGTKQ